MVREEITVKNPAADVFLLPVTKPLPGYPSIPEQEHLLDALAQDRTLHGRRDYALIATALLTGLRCSELSNLQLGHLDIAGRSAPGHGRIVSCRSSRAWRPSWARISSTRARGCSACRPASSRRPALRTGSARGPRFRAAGG